MINCLICSQKFDDRLGSHLPRIHGISGKEYYDRFFKSFEEGLCQRCNKPTGFKNTNLGYAEFCSKSCRFIMNSPMKDKKAWNYGLTKESDSRVAKYGISGSETIQKQYDNGREVWNKDLTKENDIRIASYSKILSKYMRNGYLSGEISPGFDLGRGKVFYREDLKHFFRSRWEANNARILNYLQIIWEYESKNCRFNLGELGVLILDFYLPEFNVYIEVKGYLYEDCKRKWKKFLELYPEKKVFIIDGEVYSKLTKMLKDKIVSWES